jgi:hypothetical protein
MGALIGGYLFVLNVFMSAAVENCFSAGGAHIIGQH